MTAHDPNQLPDDLPAPINDGAAAHLEGLALPPILLVSTDGNLVDLSSLVGRSVVYAYPRTGRPGVPPFSDDWDRIPGARGCTPQTCSFRDHFFELTSLGVTAIFGLSTQDTGYQKEMVDRLHLPFSVLSDENLRFTEALRLPTFTVKGVMLLKRTTLVIDDGVVSKVFYPVFPPNRSADVVADWVRDTGQQMRP